MTSLPLHTPLTSELDALAAGENFSVAPRVLPRPTREALTALYRYARLVDEIGDGGRTDAPALLVAVEADVRHLFATGSCATAALQPLAEVIRRHDLPLQPFVDLIDANRQDQIQTRYETWAELVDYCALSANPVGRLVLAVFGVTDADRVAQSDSVCTALQLVEHLQDVGEDLHRRDRVYLPAETLAACGATIEDLAAPVASPAVRAAVASECERARLLLADGGPLVRSLRGWARVAVSGYIAGGLATLAAIERADHDVLSATRRPSSKRRALLALKLWAGR